MRQIFLSVNPPQVGWDDLTKEERVELIQRLVENDDFRVIVHYMRKQSILKTEEIWNESNTTQRDNYLKGLHDGHMGLDATFDALLKEVRAEEPDPGTKTRDRRRNHV